MIYSPLVTALRRLVRRPSDRALRTLHSVHRFRRVLARERMRSDRSGDRFCLVVFTPRDDAAAHATHLRLARLFRQRLRLTDEAGWLDRSRIGVVLPATGPQGAWKVAAEIRAHFAPGFEPQCKVYFYPSDPAQFDHAGGDMRRHSTAGEPPVESLEALFMQRMPMWKRALDIVGATTGLVILSPLFFVLAAAIKIGSRGPVFFSQWRRGRGGKPFLMYKFRSMCLDAEMLKIDLRAFSEQDGPAFKIKNDPRVTRLGRLLRSTSLDELPQLWNVLRGDMSLVGPRPLPTDEADACLSWQRSRLDVTPGLTCIWQVRGRSQVSFNEWVRMDLEYIERRSLWQDVKILAATLPAVLLRRGAQ